MDNISIRSLREDDKISYDLFLMHAFRCLTIVIILALFATACKRSGTAGGAGPALNLTVTSDPNALEEARQLAAQNASAPLSPEAIGGMLRLTREELPRDMTDEQIAVELRQVIDDLDAGTYSQINAACLLELIEPGSGQEAILRLLRAAGSERKKEILIALGFAFGFGEHEPFKITNRELRTELLSSIDDPEIGETAAQTCGNLAVPGTVPALRAALPAADGGGKAEILFWLARLQPDRASFLACVDALDELAESDRELCLTALEAFLEGKDASLVQEAAEAIAGDLLKLLAAGEVDPFGFPQSSCAAVLREGNGPQVRRLAKTILAESDDEYLKRCAYLTSRRWEGPEARARIVAGLAQASEFEMALDACTELYAKTGDEAIIKALLTQAHTDRDPEQMVAIARALMIVGGRRVDAEVRAIAEALPESQKKELLLALDESSPLELARRLATAGIIQIKESAERFVAEAVAKLKQSSGEYGEYDEAELGLISLLDAAGIFLSFDVETGEIPARHDQLIVALAGASGGTFQPEACCEKMQQKNEEDYESPYTVQFIHGGRLYRYTARNYGDWYDLERVLLVCNRALADAGSAKRFFQFKSEDQVASLVCLTPRQASVLAEEFHVSFEESPDAPRKAGRAFEERVLEQMN